VSSNINGMQKRLKVCLRNNCGMNINYDDQYTKTETRKSSTNIAWWIRWCHGRLFPNGKAS